MAVRGHFFARGIPAFGLAIPKNRDGLNSDEFRVFAGARAAPLVRAALRLRLSNWISSEHLASLP